MGPDTPFTGRYTRGVTGNPYKDDEAQGGPHAPVCAIACKDLLGYSRLASVARGAGYTPLQVEGPEAVRAAAKQASCILVDLQDPAGGLAAVRAATKAPQGPLVYAIGAHVETELLQAARDAGATHVLTHNAATKQLGQILSDTGAELGETGHPGKTKGP